MLHSGGQSGTWIYYPAHWPRNLFFNKLYHSNIFCAPCSLQPIAYWLLYGIRVNSSETTHFVDSLYLKFQTCLILGAGEAASIYTEAGRVCTWHVLLHCCRTFVGFSSYNGCIYLIHNFVLRFTFYSNLIKDCKQPDTLYTSTLAATCWEPLISPLRSEYVPIV